MVEILGGVWVASVVITLAMALWGALAILITVGVISGAFYQIGKPLQ